MINDENNDLNKDGSDDQSPDSSNEGNDQPGTTGFDDEILDILRKAELNSPNDLEIPFPEYSTPDTEGDFVVPPDVQDPDRAYALYHKKIQPLVRKYVKDPQAKKLVREQINIYLKEGHVKGRDGKQAYYHLMENVITTIEDWRQETQGKDLINLYVRLVELNTDAGYVSK